MENIHRAIVALRIPIPGETELSDLRKIKNRNTVPGDPPLLLELKDIVVIRFSGIKLMSKLNSKLSGNYHCLTHFYSIETVG
jgi:hypothetical protein